MKNLNGIAKEMAIMKVIIQFSRGVLTGTYAFVIKASGVDAETLKMIIMTATLIGLLNLYLKRIEYRTVLKMFYTICVVMTIAFPFFNGVMLVIVFEVLFEIKTLLQTHIGNHIMDNIKNTINIRDYHATVDGIGTIAMLIGLSIGIGILHYGIAPVTLCVYGSMIVTIYHMVAIYRLNK